MEKKHKRVDFHLYPSEDLLEAYRELAEENGRSVSGEMIYVLKQNLKKIKLSP